MENKSDDNLLDDLQNIKFTDAEVDSFKEEERLLIIIATALQVSDSCDLQERFVLSAMSIIKQNPEMSIEDAVFAGLTEWDI